MVLSYGRGSGESYAIGSNKASNYMDSYFKRSETSTPIVSFEDYTETNDAQKVKLLHSQLAIVDRYGDMDDMDSTIVLC